MPLAVVRACLAVLEIRLELVPRWRGADLGRLRDEVHAALQSAWKRRLERWGWAIWVEVSFNHYGERGRLDLFGWHPAHGMLLVIEIKSEIDDVQALLGGLDVKRRVAPRIARDLGLPGSFAVVPFIVAADGTTNRERVARVAPLFSQFERRGRSAITWLRSPAGVPAGLLAFTDLRYASGSSVKSAGPHRIRVRREAASVDPALQPAKVRARLP